MQEFYHSTLKRLLFHKGKVCKVEKWGENLKNIPFSITSYVLLKVSPTSCWL